MAKGNEVLLSHRFFIAGSPQYPEYPGLAQKKPFWRRKEYSEGELKRRIKEYNDIFQVCFEEGYIKMKETEKGDVFSVATPKAHEISGYWGLFQALFSKYNYVWTCVIIPLFTLFIGIFISPYLKEFIKFVWGLLIKLL